MELINGSTKLLGILGFPVEHSFSPVMHNQALRYLGLDYIYLPLAVAEENLSQAIEGMKAMGFKGANVTIPHKEKIIPFLKGLSPEAQAIGAVNTLVREGEGFWGDNTDGKGFLRALAVEKGWLPEKKIVTILGAGGGARAIAVTLALRGVKMINIVNRTLSRGGKIAQRIIKETETEVFVYDYQEKNLADILRASHLVVNTTPLGMFPHTDSLAPLDYNAFKPGQLVVDIIYNPAKTRFLREAEKRGAEIMNGIGMLLYQGVLSFQSWTGEEAPVNIMKEVLEKNCEGKGGCDFA